MGRGGRTHRAACCGQASSRSRGDVDLESIRAWVERELAADASYDSSRVARFFASIDAGGPAE